MLVIYHNESKITTLVLLRGYSKTVDNEKGDNDVKKLSRNWLTTHNWENHYAT